MEITIIIAAISGLAGALAGGIVSLISQALQHKWQKEDLLFETKKKLYENMSSIGSKYVGWEEFEKINECAARCMLIAEDDLSSAILSYVALIEGVNTSVEGKDNIERDKIAADSTKAIVNAGNTMMSLMKAELNLCKKLRKKKYK